MLGPCFGLLQDLFMRMTLDGTCKVGFGVELGCLSPSLPEVPFHSNFDLANELSFHRYIDPFWKVKKFFNKGDEKVLKKCVDAMDEFVYDVINRRRAELQAAQNDGPQASQEFLYVVIVRKTISLCQFFTRIFLDRLVSAYLLC